MNALSRKIEGVPRRINCRIGGLVLFMMVALLAGCGSTSNPAGAPAPTATATSAPTATAELPEGGVIPEVTLAPTPPPSNPTPAVTVSAAGVVVTGTGEAVVGPLVAEGPTDCAIESDLDLAGYPDLEAKMGCALEEARFDAVGINEFGQGPNYDRFMLWFGWEQAIYVLYPDQTWQAFADTWDEDQPTFSCNPLDEEPASPPLPRRGFGKLWCENAAVRDAMGLIDREERLCQHAVIQRFEQGRVVACFEDATIRYFQIRDDGTWQLDTQL